MDASKICMSKKYKKKINYLFPADCDEGNVYHIGSLKSKK